MYGLQLKTIVARSRENTQEDGRFATRRCSPGAVTAE